MRPANDPATAFALLEQMARDGKRCPPNTDTRLGSEVMRELVRAGKIRICIYPRNWRSVEILTGPDAGKRTQGPPDPKAKPYKVMDAIAPAVLATPSGVQPHTFRRMPARKIAP